MNLMTKLELIWNIARWRVAWDKRDTSFVDPRTKGNPKFVSALEAASKIKDGDVVFSSGMAGNARCSILFWGIKDYHEKTGHPQNLTWIVVGAQGSRGKVPGTIEELNKPGIIKRFIAGHLETCKAQLKMGDQGLIELHNFPQGVETFLLEAQAAGKKTITTDTGVGTFIDPRTGGSTWIGGAPETEKLVAPYGDKLRYQFPPIQVSLFNLPYADAEGNLYARNASTFTEAYESSLAAKKNGGIVIAAVSDIIEKSEDEILLRADQVDYIVVNPRNEQTAGVPQYRYWPMFTVNGNTDTKDSVERLKFVNSTLKITPVRTPMENAVARLAASLFTRFSHKGALVNIGVGLPEEVCRLVYEGGLHEDITFFSETGVVGGLPAPGIYFGAAINPKEMISSAQVFHRAYENLDMTVLGLLEADSAGNVNVSRRGEKCIDFVGAGGFPDLTNSAKSIIFIGSWMAHAQFAIENGEVKIVKPGPCKFKDEILEVTFNGQRSIAKGQQVFYVTNVGVFKLTEKGMMLIMAMPGINISRDILNGCSMQVILPPDGNVETVSREIVTGEGFKLSW